MVRLYKSKISLFYFCVASLLSGAGTLGMSRPVMALEPGATTSDIVSKAKKNTALRHWLEQDKRVFVTGLPEQNQIELLLVINHAPFWYLLSLGRYTLKEGVSAPRPVKVDSKKMSESDVAIKKTGDFTTNLLSGSSTGDTVLIDQYGDELVAPSNNLAVKGSSALINLLAEGHYTQARALIESRGAKKDSSSLNTLCMLKAHDGDVKNSAKTLADLVLANDDDGAGGAVKFNLAYLSIAQGKSKEAYKILEDLKDEPSRVRLYALLTLARIGLTMPGVKSASDYADIALKSYPNNLDAMEIAGDLAQKNGQYKKAINLLTPVAQSRKNDTSYMLKIAACYKSDGDLDQAIKILNQATSITPDNAQLHIELGKLYLDNKDFLGARLQFERTMELKPDLSVARTCFAAFIKVLNVMNDNKALDTWTAKWVKDYPEAAITHYNRGWFLASIAKDKQAIQSYETAISCDPTLNTARYNLIYLLYKTGQADQAKNQAKIFLQASTSPQDKARVEAMLKEIHDKAR